MNKNKGFIGIGLIIAIILGIAVVGGGAYYLGKSGSKQEVKNPENILPNVENQNLPVVNNNQQVKVANTTNPVVSTGCTSSSIPSIKVISPKGGEVYNGGEKISVKWTSCNVQKVYVSMAQGGHDMGNLTETSILASQGSYQWIVPITQWESNTGFIFGIWDADPGHTDIVGKSGSFSINSATKKVSSELPKYIRSAFNSWPPVIKHSSVNYSCTLSHTQNQDVFEKIINNRKYCITDYYEGAAGTIYHTYTYITSSANGDGTETSNFTLGYGCGGYGGPGDEQYDQCNLNETTFKNNLNQMIDTLISK